MTASVPASSLCSLMRCTERFLRLTISFSRARRTMTSSSMAFQTCFATDVILDNGMPHHIKILPRMPQRIRGTSRPQNGERRQDMTRKLFYDDPYATECKARALAVNGDEVRLDQTVFFAFTGGQASDAGTIG